MSTIHLSSKHKILKPGTPVPLSAPRASSDITSFLSKPIMSVDERLEENILHWMVAESEPFTTVESQSFQRIFRDLPGASQIRQHGQSPYPFKIQRESREHYA
ncbi:hypothetical protein V1524DRAFT_440322 [Lipomyces starkeyi]